MSQSHEMRLLLADNAAGTTNPIALAARNCDLLGRVRFGRDPGKRGTRQMWDCGARVLGEEVSGGFNAYLTVAQLDWLIERMIGDNITGYPAAAATPGETLPAIYAFVDKSEDIFRYDLCRIASISFSFPEGDYVDARVNLIGSAEADGVTWPVGAPALECADLYVTHDVTLTIGSAYDFKNVTLNIDNNFEPNQQENNLNRVIFESRGLSVTLNGSFGYRSDTSGLYTRAIAGTDDATLVMNDGAVAYTFKFGNLKIPGDGPTVPDEGEITMDLSMDASKKSDGTTEQIEISKV